MKIRIKDDSIRLRLSSEAVHTLAENGCVESECRFPTQTLTYGVMVEDGLNAPYARFEANGIHLIIPKDFATAWLNNDEVGLYHTTEQGFSLVVEKDFQCLKPREGESEDNLYPNPQAQ